MRAFIIVVLFGLTASSEPEPTTKYYNEPVYMKQEYTTSQPMKEYKAAKPEYKQTYETTTKEYKAAEPAKKLYESIIYPPTKKVYKRSNMYSDLPYRSQPVHYAAPKPARQYSAPRYMAGPATYAPVQPRYASQYY